VRFDAVSPQSAPPCLGLCRLYTYPIRIFWSDGSFETVVSGSVPSLACAVSAWCPHILDRPRNIAQRNLSCHGAFSRHVCSKFAIGGGRRSGYGNLLLSPQSPSPSHCLATSISHPYRMSRRRKWFEGPRAPVVIAWRAHCLERAHNPAQQTLAMVVRHAFSRDTSDTCGSCRPRRTLSWTILGLFLALMRQILSQVLRSSLRGGRRCGDGDSAAQTDGDGPCDRVGD
jgi:hypothetical protein